MQRYDKPLPTPQPESDFYWQKCKEHELWLRHCKRCSQAYFYPRDICPNCFERDTDWIKASGRGTLYSFAIAFRSPNPAFEGDVPFIISMVQLEEGPIMPSNIVSVEPDPANLRVGMRLQVVFEDVTESITLPKFKPAG